MKSRRCCPICKCDSVDFLRKMQFILPQGHPLSEGYNVVCCHHCAFVYADTVVAQQDYDRFYAQFSKYEDSQTSTGGGGSPLDMERLRETARTIKDHIADPSKRILDIGCANGGLLKALQELGCSVLVGVDPSPICVANVHNDLAIKAYMASLSTLPQDIGKFDCVILSHVLEHVQDLHSAANAMHALVDVGGVVYIEVPDATRYAECLISPFQDFNTEHINHFSLPSLTNLMSSAGFRLKEQGVKTLWAAPQMPYPALYAFYEKSVTSVPVTLQKDLDLCSNIDAYIANSQCLLDAIDVKLKALLQHNNEVVVWGAGQLAMKLLIETTLSSAKILTFVDGNTVNHNKMLRGVPIVSPEQFAQMHFDQPIIITSMLHGPEIKKAIQSKFHLKNELLLL